MNTTVPTKVPDFAFDANHLRRIDDLSDEDINAITRLALYYAQCLKAHQPVVKRLAGRTQVNLFFEDSTRTNMSFELAGMKLGADVINLPVAASSVNKDEKMIDTVQTLAAMGTDVMIVRAREPGIHQFLSEQVNCMIVNAGDGTQEHPSQALLDAVTIMAECGTLNGRSIAICGDIKHSRVAGSGARLFSRLGADVRFVGPAHLLPGDDLLPDIPRIDNLHDGLADCEVVMALRMQFERMDAGKNAIDQQRYYDQYAITHESLKFASPTVRVMHPGPMNRGIEIDGALADDPEKSLILKQVFYGVPTRMAILDALINRNSAS